ncbi:hypothetical protein LUZ60_002432 [Juncus effusus]|nr:hypothetical protein LUZ60_002432 [Juncus effusus]
MAGVGSLISSILSSIAKLLPEVKNSFFAPSSSSTAQSPDARVVEDELNKLARTLKRIKATLYDAEEREIRDRSVKLWLNELKEVGHAAGYVIDEYMYEVYQAKAEAKRTSELNPRKRKQDEGSDAVLLGDHTIRVPDGIVDRIREIRSRFDEIAKDREALRLHQEDGPRRDEGVRFRVPSSHLSLEPIVFGREREKEKVIDLMFSNIREGIITVVPIVGMGGLGKTTLARLIYNERRVKQKFNLFGWTCVSDNFNVERLMQDLIESFTGESCPLKNPSALHDKIKEIVGGENVFIVLDDIWNEDKDLWELFCAPFISAVKVAFIVTTRSDRVAKIMHTGSPFRLGYLSEEESWRFFQQYAFGGIDLNVDANLLDLGKRITKKCAGLPLAIKSISNLLRYENEESWVEILENDLWEVLAENDIFRALQISYNHMPACLRPCFLLCSLFPKDYEYNVDELIELWIAEGYIESKGRRSLEEIAFEYAVELRERSFFDPIFGDASWYRFKMHDMVHDLARLSLGNEFCFIESGQPNPPDEIVHSYMDDFEGLLTTLNFNNVARLRTLILNTISPTIDFSKAKSLRALILNEKSHHYWQHSHRSGSIFSLYHLEKLNLCSQDNLSELEMINDLINLKFLSLSHCDIERIPDSLCFLSNLRNLSIRYTNMINMLPEQIGNLVCLEKLVIRNCAQLCFLPESLCKLSGLKTLRLTSCWKITKLPNDIGNLTNLRSLIVNSTGINYLPRSFSKLNIFTQLNVEFSVGFDGLTSIISWLKDFNVLKGALAILQLGRMPSLQDARNFNLVSKRNLEKLVFSWSIFGTMHKEYNVQIELGTNDDKKIGNTSEPLGKDMDLQVLQSLQPHPNLKHLYIYSYGNSIFPGWMGDPLSCASLEKMCIIFCTNITHLPFGSLKSLKWLQIVACTTLQAISRDFLPSQLETLEMVSCSSLLSVTGLEDLESLDALVIDMCDKLKYFPFELISEERSYQSSSTGLKNLSPPKKVNIIGCPSLQLAENEVVPSVHCKIEIYCCPGLEEWCLRHNISYDSSIPDYSRLQLG